MLGKEDLIKLKNLPKNIKEIIDNLISKTNKHENDINVINSDLDSVKSKMDNVEHDDLIKLKNLPVNTTESFNSLINKTDNHGNDINNINAELNKVKSKVDMFEQQDVTVTVPIINNVLNLTTNKRQKTTMENNTTIVLPEVNKFTEIHLIFSTTEAPKIILPGNVRWQDDVEIEANKKYEFIFTYEDEWMGGVVVYR